MHVSRLFLFIPLLAGCVSAPDPTVPPAAAPVMPALKAAVVTGLTSVDPAAYGGWKGDCPGCDLDAGRMAHLLETRGFAVKAMANAEATRFRFLTACASAAVSLAPAAKAGLNPILVIYNSSHGGQVADLNGDEPDKLDETVCLWDGELTDDLMWEALCKVPAGVTVVFISDSCNSGSVFRAPKDWVKAVGARASRAPGTLKCGFIHMSGCPDGQSSYGGPDGGVFTNCLLKSYKPGIRWDVWIEAVRKKMPRNQIPVFGTLGPVTLDKEAL